MGRIVYEAREDGFCERTSYDEETGQIIKIDTTYPNGIREVEQFSVKK